MHMQQQLHQQQNGGLIEMQDSEQSLMNDSSCSVMFNSNGVTTTPTGGNGNSKSILSELNIDELFMLYPSVFEEFFYSNNHPLFKLNSIEQIENDLRQFCEQQFKLNLSSAAQNGHPVPREYHAHTHGGGGGGGANATTHHQQHFSIRI
jgi:hypothetical protein